MLEAKDIETSDNLPEDCNTKDLYSDLIRGHLKPERVARGRVTCLLSVAPPIIVTISSLPGAFLFFLPFTFPVVR